MTEEKQKARIFKRFIWICISIYFLIVAGYCVGKSAGERLGLEYRFWADACFRIWVWFVPILLAGVMLMKACIKQWKRKSAWKWILSVLLVGYIGIAAYASLLYVLINAFTITSDERMPDGNLVVAVPFGMESIHHYAEPVGLFFRREFDFDEVRTADSLSKIYGVPFQVLREENGQWVYGSVAYPEVEVTNIRYGYTEVSYLDNDLELALTSKMLKEHQDVFDSRGVELVSYLYGQSERNPEGLGTYTSVLVSEENKERAAEAISEFIKMTLQEDLRPDGKCIWDCVDGNIFLVAETEESGKYQSIRNIPFALRPQYSWIFDASVTVEELAEEIVIKRETSDKAEDEVPESIEEGPETMESSDNNSVAEESSQELLDRYLSIEPSCSFMTEDGLEYRMVGVDRALGSSFYVLIGVEEQGKNCTFVNPDPYNGSGGEARWITFVDEKLGFSCLAHAAGSYGSLYRTEDGGYSFEVVEYPSPNVKLSDGTYYNPFVMPEKVYEEDGILYMEVGQGSDGDYYDAELGFCHGLYRSSDLGLKWEFVQLVDSEYVINQAIIEAILNQYKPEKPDGLYHCAEFVLLEQEEICGVAPVNSGKDNIELITVFCLALHESSGFSGVTFHEVEYDYVPVKLQFQKESESEYTLKKAWFPEKTYESWDIYQEAIWDAFSTYSEELATDVIYAVQDDIYLTSLRQRCYEQAVNYGEVDTDTVVEGLLEEVVASPGTFASGVKDYIVANEAAYKELIHYGKYTLWYCFGEFLEGGQTDLRGQIMASVCRDISFGWGEALLIDSKNPAATGQDWFDIFRSNAEELQKQYSEEELNELYPASWLLLQVIQMQYLS